MKKFLLLAFIAICIGVFIPSKLFAANVSIGATVWYANWDTDYESEEYDSTELYPIKWTREKEGTL